MSAEIPNKFRDLCELLGIGHLLRSQWDEAKANELPSCKGVTKQDYANDTMRRLVRAARMKL